MGSYPSLLVILLSVLSVPASFAQDKNDEPEGYGCRQSQSDRERFIDEATRASFVIRRVEISGSTYTRHREFVKRMRPGLLEGDAFTRAALEKSIRRISKMDLIYPLTTDDVELRLDRADRNVDIVICVRQKPKR